MFEAERSGTNLPQAVGAIRACMCALEGAGVLTPSLQATLEYILHSAASAAELLAGALGLFHNCVNPPERMSEIAAVIDTFLAPEGYETLSQANAVAYGKTITGQRAAKYKDN